MKASPRTDTGASAYAGARTRACPGATRGDPVTLLNQYLRGEGSRVSFSFSRADSNLSGFCDCAKWNKPCRKPEQTGNKKPPFFRREKNQSLSRFCDRRVQPLKGLKSLLTFGFFRRLNGGVDLRRQRGSPPPFLIGPHSGPLWGLCGWRSLYRRQEPDLPFGEGTPGI